MAAIGINLDSPLLALEACKENKDLAMLETLVKFDNPEIIKVLKDQMLDSFEKIAANHITGNQKLETFLEIESPEDKMTLEEFTKCIEKMVPRECLDEFEIHSLYWVMFMKYKHKLRYKRFLQEFQFISKTWIGLDEYGDLTIYFIFVTKDGKLRGRGGANVGGFTLEGNVSKGNKVYIKLKSVNNYTIDWHGTV